jgi:hypothetical protein
MEKKIVTVRKVKVEYLTFEGFINKNDENIIIDDGRNVLTFPLSEIFSLVDAPQS